MISGGVDEAAIRSQSLNRRPFVIKRVVQLCRRVDGNHGGGATLHDGRLAAEVVHVERDIVGAGASA